MSEIRTRVRPKLDAIGETLAPAVSRSIGGEVFVHVARHARRTVIPPDDTWVAFGPDARGYKQHVHFKVAVSRGGVRFPLRDRPEHAEKQRWASAWKKNAPKVGPVLRRMRHLGWFKNEHDDEPASPLADLTPEGLAELGRRADPDSRRTVRRRPRGARRRGGPLDRGAVPVRGARHVPCPRATLTAWR